MLYLKLYAVHNDAASTASSFQTFMQRPDHDRLFSCLFQIAYAEKSLGIDISKRIFANNGAYIDKKSVSDILNRLCSFYKYAHQLAARDKVHPLVFEEEDTVLRNVDTIHALLQEQPDLISIKGRIAVALAEDIQEHPESFYSDLSPEELSFIRQKIRDTFSPKSLEWVDEGQMNTVYKAHLPLPTGERTVLIALRTPKKSAPHKTCNPYAIQASIQENLYEIMEAQSKKAGPLARIPKVFFFNSDINYIAMEYISGKKTLFSLLDPMDPPKITEKQKKYIYTVLEKTLDFWRTKDPANPIFIHRDLHPGNVMIDFDGETPVVYIIDFDTGILYPHDVVMRSNKYVADTGYISGPQERVYDSDRQILDFINNPKVYVQTHARDN